MKAFNKNCVCVCGGGNQPTSNSNENKHKPFLSNFQGNFHAKLKQNIFNQKPENQNILAEKTKFV